MFAPLTALCARAECYPAPSANVTCPRNAWVYQAGSSMSPGCDASMPCDMQLNFLLSPDPMSGKTTAGTRPNFMLDMGFARTDVTSVRITSGMGADLPMAGVISIYLSASRPFDESSSVLCRANITFAVTEMSSLKEELAIACPLGVAARYVTITRSNANAVSLPACKGC